MKAGKKPQVTILTTNECSPQGLAQTICESISNVTAVVSTRILGIKNGDFLFDKNDFMELSRHKRRKLPDKVLSIPSRFSILIIDAQPVYFEGRTLHAIKPDEIMEIYAAGTSFFENLAGIVIICDEADKYRFENL